MPLSHSAEQVPKGPRDDAVGLDGAKGSGVPKWTMPNTYHT